MRARRSPVGPPAARRVGSRWASLSSRQWIVAKGVKTRLAERLDPVLGPSFTRHRWVWNRRAEPVVHVLELFGSKHGTGDLSFEWGLVPAGWVEFARATTEPALYSASDCAISGSLGDFHGASGWWDHAAVEGHLPEDLHHLSASHLLPFFDEMSSLEALLALAERGYRAYPQPRPTSPLDERGWPRTWSWPRLPDHQRFVQGTLMLLLGMKDDGIARLEEASDSEWARRVLREQSHR